MKVCQVLIHNTEYFHGYKDDESWTTFGPTYHDKNLAEQAKAHYNATHLDTKDFVTYATVREIEVLNYFNPIQLTF